jgi:hypothetical protein
MKAELLAEQTHQHEPRVRDGMVVVEYHRQTRRVV